MAKPRLQRTALRVAADERQPAAMSYTDPIDTTGYDFEQTFDDEPDHRIVEGMVRALTEVLQLPARHCRMSALHGLGHLKHPAKEDIIRTFFLAENRDLDAELSAYAEKAIQGKVL